MKLYLIDWGDGMIGGFEEEDLTDELDEVYITYEQLNRMRTERSFELKSLI